MESYGELLRNAREAKNLDLNKVSREISIEKRYLVALENEDSGVFPGTAYLVGFLKNYSNFLELDAEFILKLYHNKLVQESPLPKGLYEQKSPKNFFLFLIFAGIFAVIAAAVLIPLAAKKKAVAEAKIVIAENSKVNQYEIGDEKFTKRVYKDDRLLIPAENGEKIALTVRDTLSSFGIDAPSGVFYVDLAEESEIDVDGDGVPDVILYVSDISSTDERRGAEINALLRRNSNRAASAENQNIPLVSEIKTERPLKVILEDNRAYPFTVNASFRAPCLFRDKVDNSNSSEAYFTRGEIFTATAKNGIRLWISNNAAVKITVIAGSHSSDLDNGVAGQIMAEDIKWIKDGDGKYKLAVIELD